MSAQIIDQARELYKNGKREESRELLKREIRGNVKDPELWFALYWCVDEPKQKQDCLERVIKLNPENEKAKAEIIKLWASNAQKHVPPVESIIIDQPPLQNTEITEKLIPNEKVNQKTPPLIKTDVPIMVEKPVQKTVPPKKVPKNAGDSTYKLVDKRRWIGIGIGLGVIAIVIILSIILSNKDIIKLGGPLALIFLAIIIFSRPILAMLLKPVEKKIKQAKRGAKAEVQIGDLLANLGEDYLVIHDVMADYGNIDHVVISKEGGIYMIETKSHGGRITIEDNKLLLNGHTPEKDFIAQSLRNSFWMREKIESVIGTKPWITPILVFTNAFIPFYPPFRGVYLTNKKYLLKTITGQAKNKKLGTLIWEKRDQMLEIFQ